MTFTRLPLVSHATYPSQYPGSAAALLPARASNLTPPGGATGRPEIIIYYSEELSGVKKKLKGKEKETEMTT